MEKIIPEFLEKKIKEQYNDEEASLILKGLMQNRQSSFRVNRIKSSYENISEILNQNSIKFMKNEFLKDAFIINEEDVEKIKLLDIYNNGEIYLQSLSSMMPVIALDPKEKENILDMCAAPRR